MTNRPNRTAETAAAAAAAEAAAAAAEAAAAANDAMVRTMAADDPAEAAAAAAAAAEAAAAAAAAAAEAAADPAEAAAAAAAAAEAAAAAAAAAEIAESLNLLGTLTGSGTGGQRIAWPAIFKTLESNGGLPLPDRFPAAPSGVKLAVPGFCGTPKNLKALNLKFAESGEKNVFLRSVLSTIAMATTDDGGSTYTLNHAVCRLLFLQVQRERKNADERNVRYRAAVKDLPGLMATLANLSNRYSILRVDNGEVTVKFIKAFYSDAV